MRYERVKLFDFSQVHKEDAKLMKVQYQLSRSSQQSLQCMKKRAYFAPEILNKDDAEESHVTCKADVYAFRMLIGEVLSL